MNRVFKSTILVTLLTFIGQVITFATQMVVAYLFGANASMDAYNVAFVLPQYINVTLLGSLGFVFLPVFIKYITTGQFEDAWRIASSTINLCIIVVGGIMSVGMLFPDMTLNLIAPGLSNVTKDLAVQLSIILWPSVLGIGLTTLLTLLYHADSRFSWPSFVPIIGSGFGLVFTILLARQWGIMGFAYGTTIGSFLQVLLLAPIVFRRGRYQFIVDWKNDGLRQIYYLLIPLLLASIFGKATGLVERFLASSMPEGTISHLSYALRMVSMLSFLFSSGVSTVLFQQMATYASSGEIQQLRHTISVGIRYLWLAVAPVLTLGFVLALPLIEIVFRRGEFSYTDAVSVSQLFKVYLLSLAASSFGNIVARGFYVLEDTVTVAWMVGVESLLYILYTFFLSRWYGPVGIALGYVFLFNGSMIWQILIIAYKTGGIKGGRVVIQSLTRTSLAALTAGITVAALLQVVSGEWQQLLFGGLTGLLVYLTVLFGIKSPEGYDVANLIYKSLKFRAA